MSASFPWASLVQKMQDSHEELLQAAQHPQPVGMKTSSQRKEAVELLESLHNSPFFPLEPQKLDQSPDPSLTEGASKEGLPPYLAQTRFHHSPLYLCHSFHPYSSSDHLDLYLPYPENYLGPS
ncbi:hypothetical protein RchiOBHm_Chr5g0053711 [Rosa chinensis]|uniref:Uncharacterized protein n=1 Tax=Rosa chinensis TaxID=74649 RepID=A0A2P6QG00_ROSCH|nr:hypothetical protein RchiOBHm_Chr5g0053711 [Rosa chinensis]